MAAITISKGENFIIRRDLFLADGVTPLLVSTLESCQVSLIQADKIIKSYTLGTPEVYLREGLTNNQLELEIDTVTSNLINFGKAKLSWKIKRTNPVFTVEGKQLDCIVEDDIIVIS